MLKRRKDSNLPVAPKSDGIKIGHYNGIKQTASSEL